MFTPMQCRKCRVLQEMSASTRRGKDLGPGPEGYPRVLDYSIFKSLLVPYPKIFTTRASSRVVLVFIFLSNHSNIQKMERWHFCYGLRYHSQQQNVAITVLWHWIWMVINLEYFIVNSNQILKQCPQSQTIYMLIPNCQIQTELLRQIFHMISNYFHFSGVNL